MTPYVLPGHFSAEWCQNVINMAHFLVPPVVADPWRNDPDIRVSEIRWLPDTSMWEMIYQDLHRLFNRGDAIFHTVSETIESLQFTTYSASVNGHYNTWHDDTQPWLTRVLSMSVQLTSAADYDGADFQFQNDAADNWREQGTVIIFPSTIKHRVTPITRGVRHALVAWRSAEAN